MRLSSLKSRILSFLLKARCCVDGVWRWGKKKPVWRGKPEQFVTATCPLWFLRTRSRLWQVGDRHLFINDPTRKFELGPHATTGAPRTFLSDSRSSLSLANKTSKTLPLSNFFVSLRNLVSWCWPASACSGFCSVLDKLQAVCRVTPLDEVTELRGESEHDVWGAVAITPAPLIHLKGFVNEFIRFTLSLMQVIWASQQKMWIPPVVCWHLGAADENPSDISLAEMSTEEVMFSRVRWASIVTFWCISWCFKDTRPNETHQNLLWKTKRRSYRL